MVKTGARLVANFLKNNFPASKKTHNILKISYLYIDIRPGTRWRRATFAKIMKKRRN